MATSIPSTSVGARSRDIWLIGDVSESSLWPESITGSYLPSTRQVMSRFFYLHTLKKKTIPESALITAKETQNFWTEARIPTKHLHNITTKIKKQHQQLQLLRKTAKRQTQNQQLKEDSYTAVLDDLFDVAHADALSLIKIKEDRDFLIAQREEGRRRCVGGVEKVLRGVEKRQLEKEEKAAKRRKLKEECMAADSFATYNETMNDNSYSSGGEDDNGEVDQKPVYYSPVSQKPKRPVPQKPKRPVPQKPKRRKAKKPVNILTPEVASSLDRAKKPVNILTPEVASSLDRAKKPVNILTPEVASSLDRARVSDQNATLILASVAKALGHDPTQFAVNKESVRRSRRLHRETAAPKITETFYVEGLEGPVTVQWDAKVEPDQDI